MMNDTNNLTVARKHSAHIILAEVHHFAREYERNPNDHRPEDDSFDELWAGIFNEDDVTAKHFASAVRRFVTEWKSILGTWTDWN
jgi:hypothetical protein